MTLAKNETLEERLPETLSNGGVRVTPTGTVTVDSELPAAAVPTDSDANGAVPAVAARLQAQRADTNQSARLYRTMADGSPQPMDRGLTVTPQAYDVPGTAGYPARTARSLGDAEAGQWFGATASMLYNGATWQRARAPSREVILASSPRVASSDPGIFAAPSLTNRGFRACILWLTITEAPASTAGGITMKVTGPGGASVLTQAGISAPGDLVKTAGTYYWVLGSVIQNGGVRPAGIPTSIPAGTLESPVASSSVPLPAVFTPQVWHRTSVSESWTYSLSIDWCL